MLAIYDDIVRIGNGELQTLDDNLYSTNTFNSGIDSNARIKEREQRWGAISTKLWQWFVGILIENMRQPNGEFHIRFERATDESEP